MGIKEIKEFHIIKTIEETDKTPRILIENKQLKKQVEMFGKILEAQYRIGDNFLLLVTEGSPFEEALYIYYLNYNLKMLDSLELSAMYAEGMLRNLSVIDSDKIKFSFFENNEQWVLEIFSSAKFRIWTNKYPVKRKLSIVHRNWLKLTKS